KYAITPQKTGTMLWKVMEKAYENGQFNAAVSAIKELNQLGWWQRQVALLLEARDALAPQVQALVRRIGDLAVILLTQVLGRAIGLVGRGIAQGMGRSFGRG
ncbi:MAG: DUF3685 domain-containing protein, partial [Synechococcus sp.]